MVIYRQHNIAISANSLKYEAAFVQDCLMSSYTMQIYVTGVTRT